MYPEDLPLESANVHAPCRHGGEWLPAAKTWQMPAATVQAALKDLMAAPGLRVEVEDVHPITDKIMQVNNRLSKSCMPCEHDLRPWEPTATG